MGVDRLVTMTVALVATAFMLYSPTPAAADPPDPVGWTPVDQRAMRGFGALDGSNGSSHSTCIARGRQLLVTTGDFRGYRGPGGRWHVANKALVTDAATGRFLWGARAINGWVQTSHCVAGRIYFGGGFTSFNGVRRVRTAAISARDFRLLGWSAPSRAQVWDITSGGDGLFVAGGTRVARVDAASGRTVWRRDFDCTVRTVAHTGRFLYVGGFFDKILRPDRSRLAGARGLAKLRAATGWPAAVQPVGSAPNKANCREPVADTAAYSSGSNPLSLDVDRGRGRVVSCEGGRQNRVRAVSIATGRNAWVRSIAGDGQVCLMVKSYVFVGFHRSGANVIEENSPNWGAMGMVLRGGDGRQAIWEPPIDFAGAGADRDNRNNGIIGAVYLPHLGQLHVTGAFTSVDGLKKRGLAAFAVDR